MEVAVIPMQEELEVRLEESSLPAPEWVDQYEKKSSSLEDRTASSISDESIAGGKTSVQYPGGHVKLELEGKGYACVLPRGYHLPFWIHT